MAWLDSLAVAMVTSTLEGPLEGPLDAQGRCWRQRQRLGSVLLRLFAQGANGSSGLGLAAVCPETAFHLALFLLG